MKLHRVACAVLIYGIAGPGSLAVELPEHYFDVLESALTPLAGQTNLKSNPGAMLSAAVLYAKRHPDNPSFGDKEKLELALRLGDLFARESEKDTAENRQDYEWEIHFWL